MQLVAQEASAISGNIPEAPGSITKGSDGGAVLVFGLDDLESLSNLEDSVIFFP